MRLKRTCNAPDFDLVICDEAHRTTGIEAEEISKGKTKGNYFTLINRDDYVKAKKRLYMTATPKIYHENVKNKANKNDVELHSMDDTEVYGEEIYRLDFSKAIEQNLLSDYKVIILDIDANLMSDNMSVQSILKGTKLNIEEASRLIGCYKALRDQGDEKNGKHLKRAVAFLNTLDDSRDTKKGFLQVVKALDEHQDDGFTCDLRHIEGKDHSIKKAQKLSWLKEDAGFNQEGEQVCRILTNAKCLTEGIDVPSLDAVLFLQPRKSQVDVVQAVGRVIRQIKGKKYGYIILPVVIPPNKTPEGALNDNKTYKVVWQVLNALRSHDNKLDIEIDNLGSPNNKIKVLDMSGQNSDKKQKNRDRVPHNYALKQYTTGDIEHRIFPKIVEKCGNRAYKEKWIKETGEIHNRVAGSITDLIDEEPQVKETFQKYFTGLHNNINTNISKENAISMLADHLITKGVFDKIFEGYKFSEHNPISKAMSKILSSLKNYGLNNELKKLERFYKAISLRVERAKSSKRRQEIIKEFYEDFIKEAVPKLAEKLGVAYTPIEIVDFILHSCNDLLNKEFGKKLTDKDVHVIDPFVGTGTFINRLIQNEDQVFIEDKDLKHKFENELYANEIMLLPYYIASVNIEEAYHSRFSDEDYKAFPGITLTDTFTLTENIIDLKSIKDTLENDPFYENKQRIINQEKAPIKVIVGNPPYSVGQKSENDGNKNTKHSFLDSNVRKTYVKESTSTNKNALYDSYIKAIRWATDRLGNKEGIIGFVHNASLRLA